MDQPIEIVSPLGDDVLRFVHMTAAEELGRLFDFDLEVVSENLSIKGEDLLGQTVTVKLGTINGGTRYFHGHVIGFSQTETAERFASYELRLRPWFWFLTRTSDCRIFQGKTVPDIIKEVFREHGFSDFKDSLSGSYRTWDYCVQYRETDFNFLSRLMEQEGIYYYFTHEESKHTLVLCDSISGHNKIPGYEEVPFLPGELTSRRTDFISDWLLSLEVQSGAVALNDFDFTKPKAKLLAQVSDPSKHDKADFEIYDHPGEYLEKSDGETYAKTRLEEVHVQYERVRGSGNARGLTAGGLFKLTDHPRADQNREYLIVSIVHELRYPELESGSGEPEFTYEGRFAAIDSHQQFRTERLTPKPIVQGPQTAMVVGKAGEEIWTDEYGRVKVQFHWDRYGKSDENSSCWVRVSQVWAGKTWGAIHIPRIGQEVITEFIEGDPDRPIITGRVYNAEAMPPYGLPDNQTQSGIKSRSTKGGSGENFNEIRFEDKKGEEEVYFHAEKDENTVVEHDQGISVGNDRAESIGRDRSLQVGRDKSETVERNKTIQVVQSHTEQIGSDMTITVGKNLTESVAINYTETVGAAMELTVGAALAVSVGAGMTASVGGDASASIGGNSSEDVGGNSSSNVGADLTENVGGANTVEVGKDSKETIGGKQEVTVAKEHILNAKKIQMVAKDEISIKTGSAEITMKKSGDITIKGKKINIKGSGDVIVKGSNIKEN